MRINHSLSLLLCYFALHFLYCLTCLSSTYRSLHCNSDVQKLFNAAAQESVDLKVNVGALISDNCCGWLSMTFLPRHLLQY